MEGLGAADGDVDEMRLELLAIRYNGVVVHCVLLNPYPGGGVHSSTLL